MFFLFTWLSLTCCLSYFVIFCDILSWNSDLDFEDLICLRLTPRWGTLDPKWPWEQSNRATETKRKRSGESGLVFWVMTWWHARYGWWHDMDMGIIWYRWYGMMGMVGDGCYDCYEKMMMTCDAIGNGMDRMRVPREWSSMPTELRPWAAFAMTCWLAAFRAKCGMRCKNRL